MIQMGASTIEALRTHTAVVVVHTHTVVVVVRKSSLVVHKVTALHKSVVPHMKQAAARIHNLQEAAPHMQSQGLYKGMRRLRLAELRIVRAVRIVQSAEHTTRAVAAERIDIVAVHTAVAHSRSLQVAVSTSKQEPHIASELVQHNLQLHSWLHKAMVRRRFVALDHMRSLWAPHIVVTWVPHIVGPHIVATQIVATAALRILRQVPLVVLQHM